MAPSPPRLSFAAAAFALCALAATPLPAQPARVPASTLGPPADGPMAGHPYKDTLGAVWNYGSCGVHARSAARDEIEAALRRIEAAAEAKGLGPTLERLRGEYQRLLAVSSIMPCPRGARVALADARRALAAFRAWVAAQPGQP